MEVDKSAPRKTPRPFAIEICLYRELSGSLPSQLENARFATNTRTVAGDFLLDTNNRDANEGE